MTEHDQLIAKITELRNSVRGLALDVERWRQHTSASGDFMLVELEHINDTINELIQKIK